MNETNKKPNVVVRVFKFFWSLIKGYLMGVGLLFTLLPVLLLLFLSRGDGTRTPSLPTFKPDDAVYLKMDLNGPLLDRSPDKAERFFSRLLRQDEPIYLPEFRGMLRRASRSEHIKGIFLDISHLQGSLTEFAELRSIFSDFKQSGKLLHVFLSEIETGPYLVASVADQITIQPAAGANLVGIAAQMLYFGEALKKVGVEVEIIRAGKFKSAVEPFIRNEPSQESKENLAALTQSLQSSIVQWVSEGRARGGEAKPERVREWFSQSFYTAEEALKAGIVDAIAQTGEAESALEKASGAKDVMKFSSFTKIAAGLPDVESVDTEDGIALIEAHGEIFQGSSRGGNQELEITPEQLEKEIIWAKDEDHVKAVVFRINSPGGSAIASDMIWARLSDLAKVKPLIVCMGDVAASGGYYIAVAGQKIIASPLTVTGSIGVFGLIPKATGFKDKYGVSFFTMTESKRKEVLDPGLKSDPEDLAILNRSLEATYALFKSRVTQGRKQSPDQIENHAQGRVFTGTQALAAGLVDEIGGVTEAFKAAKSAAGLDPEKLYPLYVYEPDHPKLSQCFESTMDLIDCLNNAGVRTFSLRTIDAKWITPVQDVNHFVSMAQNSRQHWAYWPGRIVVP